MGRAARSTTGATLPRRSRGGGLRRRLPARTHERAARPTAEPWHRSCSTCHAQSLPRGAAPTEASIGLMSRGMSSRWGAIFIAQSFCRSRSDDPLADENGLAATPIREHRQERSPSWENGAWGTDAPSAVAASPNSGRTATRAPPPPLRRGASPISNGRQIPLVHDPQRRTEIYPRKRNVEPKVAANRKEWCVHGAGKSRLHTG
jgi:hypothetical protein